MALVTKAAQCKVLGWLSSGDTGISSETIAYWLAFGLNRPGGNHPLDPADFNRCLVLLQKVPELREFLFRMKSVSPIWKRLVDAWDRIEALFLEEAGLNWSKTRSAPKTYALMKEVIRNPAV